MRTSSLLLVIGSNPPSQTSGARTLARVDLARAILDLEQAHLVNLFALPTYRSGGLAELGKTSEGWVAARREMRPWMEKAAAVLLAYGTKPPSGPARVYFRDQVEWLGCETERHGLPTWWVGGAPRHPSRWQRYTWRTHPDHEFAAALRLSLHLRGR